MTLKQKYKIEKKVREHRRKLRKEAKKAKNFAEADRIRDELAAQGIKILDTREGTTWSRE
jgi:cysteinyl-tRNA synthetase